MRHGLLIVLLLLSVRPVLAERINPEGRILGALPVVTDSILFNTTNADAVVSAKQVFPAANPWNENISLRPVLVNSDAMFAQITVDLSATQRSLRIFKEMNLVRVPDSQPTVPIQFVDYPDESDLGGGPFPSGLYPISTKLEWGLAVVHSGAGKCAAGQFMEPRGQDPRSKRQHANVGGAGFFRVKGN